MRRPTTLALVSGAILCLALGLRLYRADAQSLWYDEGTSVTLATRSLAQIARDASNDIHPPLYYWLLALWSRVFGNAPMAARTLSACIGTVAVAGTYAVARRLWGAPTAIVAGLLAATSPYLVWYSQEVRMYILAAALATLLVLFTLSWIGRAAELNGTGGRSEWSGIRRASDRGRHGGLPLQRIPRPSKLTGASKSFPIARAYTVLAFALLFTHYFAGASALAVANLIALSAVLRAWRADRKFPRAFSIVWIRAQGIAVACFLPWLAYAWHTLRDWPAISPPVTAGQLATGALETFALGTQVPPELQVWWVVLAGIAGVGIACAGIAWGSRVTTLWTLAPVLLIGILSLSRPAWNPKFLIAAAPGFELLLAAGTVAAGALVMRIAARFLAGGWPTVIGAVTTATLVAACLWPRAQILHATYFDPTYQRDDYRGIVARIAAGAGAGDVVVLNAPSQVEIFSYYDKGKHLTAPLPVGRPPDRDATLAALARLPDHDANVWGVWWAAGESDPEGLVEDWLNRSFFKVSDEWVGHVRLVRWASERSERPMYGLMGPESEPFQTFGDGEIALHSVDLSFANELDRWPSPDENTLNSAAPGDVLTFALQWKALKSPASDYTVFTQLLDAQQHVVAQRDMRPIGGSARTSKWRPGDLPDLDRIGLALPDDVPPGDYELIVGLYDPAAGGKRLAVRQAASSTEAAEEDAVLIERVRIQTR